MRQTPDEVLRALTIDGAFRVITARTTQTVRAVIAAQGATDRVSRLLADLLTGAVLVRETLAPSLRVQAIVKGAGGRGSIVADSRPGGATRGLLQQRSGAASLALGPGALLQIMRTLPSGSTHHGIVDASGSGGLGQALMTYMQESEQVYCVVAVGNIIDDGVVTCAGGYMVQLLPEAERPAHAIMTARLDAFPGVESVLAHASFSPRSLADELLYGMPFGVTSESQLRFECGCSMTTVLSSLATLQTADIRELVDEGEVLEITCDYCGVEYEVHPERLRALLAST